MAEADDILQQYDGPSTADVLAGMPTPDPMRDYSGYLLDQERRGKRSFSPETRALLSQGPHKDVLSGIFPGAQDAAGRALESIPPEAALVSNFLSPAGAGLAAFIGPTGARNLANAKMRHPDDWGGTNRLGAAKAATKDTTFILDDPHLGRRPEYTDIGPELPLFQASGVEAPSTKVRINPGRMSPEEIWREFGWTAPDTWGRAPHSGWMTWLPVEDLRLKATPPPRQPSIFTPTAGRHGEPVWEGQFSQQFEPTAALEALKAAAPGVGRIRAKFALDPEANVGGTGFVGATEFTPKRRVPEVMGASAQRMDELIRAINHEGQHAISHLHNAPNIALGDAASKPIYGSEAQRIQNQLVQEAQKDVEQSMTRAARAHYVKKMQDLERVPKQVGYLKTPWEMQARETEMRAHMPMSQQIDTIPGITIDTYGPQAWPGWAETTGVPLSAYRPPATKKKP